MNAERYDTSWDQGDEKAWDRKYKEWESRDWVEWREFVVWYANQ